MGYAIRIRIKRKSIDGADVDGDLGGIVVFAHFIDGVAGIHDHFKLISVDALHGIGVEAEADGIIAEASRYFFALQGKGTIGKGSPDLHDIAVANRFADIVDVHGYRK